MVATRRKKKELLYSFLQTSSAVKCLNFLGCAPACVCPLCLPRQRARLRGVRRAEAGGQAAFRPTSGARVPVCMGTVNPTCPG